MGKEKAVILAGVGIGAAGLTYYLMKKIAPPSAVHFTCPYNSAHTCFTTYDQVYAHMQVCPDRPVSPPPVYFCIYCGGTFSTNEDLQAHITAMHRTLWFKAAKFPGAGDPTNTIQISTDLGIIQSVESGKVAKYKEITVPIQKLAKWVMIKNLDGSALELVKYPIIGGTSLTEARVLEHSTFYESYPEYLGTPSSLGKRWGLDWVKFSLPSLGPIVQVSVRIEGSIPLLFLPAMMKISTSPDRTFATEVTDLGTWIINQIYPARAYVEVTAASTRYLKLECVIMVAFIHKGWLRGVQVMDVKGIDDTSEEFYMLAPGSYIIFEVVSR